MLAGTADAAIAAGAVVDNANGVDIVDDEVKMLSHESVEDENDDDDDDDDDDDEDGWDAGRMESRLMLMASWMTFFLVSLSPF